MFLVLNFIAGLLVLISQYAYALPDDTEKKMHINAGSTILNYKSGFNIYEGNVKIDQGETRLTADRVTTQNNNKHKIEVAIAYGTTQLAHYWTLPHEGDLPFHAKAKIIKFYPQKSLVILEGNVFVTQGNNSFSGAMLTYNLKDQTIISPPNTKGRATIIIEPAKL
jgi:lipopolysaccharide export system protein LptA